MTLPETRRPGPRADTGRLLDASSPLIGREAELAQLGRALAAPEARLLTLTGPPGVGKTRLALAVAHAVAPRFADGVVFVDLAPVRDPDLVIVEVARALGLREASGGSVAGRVGHALADKELLLVVDNCEQVVAAGPGPGRSAADLSRPAAAGHQPGAAAPRGGAGGAGSARSPCPHRPTRPTRPGWPAFPPWRCSSRGCAASNPTSR